MHQGNYNFRSTRAHQNRFPNSPLAQNSSSIPFEIEDSHTETDEELIFDTNMGDPDNNRDLLAALIRSQQDMQDNVNRMTNLMTQFMANNINQHQNNGRRNNQHQKNGGNNGGRDEQSVNNQPERTGTARPFMPTFTARNQPPENEPTIREIQEEIHQDWLGSGEEFRSSMTFREYLDVRMKHRPRGQRGNNSELQRKIGKISIPYFDGSGKTTARAWVQKLDTYFQLNPMLEEEAIKYVALHLDGVAHEWWHHGQITLGHNLIGTYVEFTEKLIDRFDSKDLELHLKDLTQLKQTRTVEQYISEFEKLVVLVTEISERHKIVIFIDGLSDSLKGWVKSLNPLIYKQLSKEQEN